MEFGGASGYAFQAQIQRIDLNTEKVSALVPVSVVIPCFRCTQTLERAVVSVAGQTALPQELILVDDCSGDETRSLMIQLQGKYKADWIRLVLLDVNTGAASARNVGWSHAAGEFVAFLDADDAWHPRKIELQYHFMKSAPEVAISGHGHAQVDGSVHVVDVDNSEFHQVSPLYVLLKNPFVTPSFMVRRNLEFRFPEGRRYMEDHYFLMHVSLAGYEIAKNRLPLAYIFKPIFGQSGLSADLMQMQSCELENYRLMGEGGYISHMAVILLKAYSWLKFFRRYLIVFARGMRKGL